MNKLPESYIVNCNQNTEYCREVYSNFYNNDFRPSDWRYITCSPLIKNAQFESTGEYSAENCINDTIYSLEKELKFLPVFTYEEWKKLKDYKFPEKWCIDVRHNPEIIGDWFNKNTTVPISYRSSVDYRRDLRSNPYFHHPSPAKGSCTAYLPEKGYTEISFKEFEENVLNKLGIKVEKMEKEIIGYKLKEACWKYKDSAKQIAVNCSCAFDFDKMFKTNVTAVKLWREAGVLDLWFEPCYKEEEFKVGDWVYAEKSASSDYRYEEGDKYIPVFQIKEVATLEISGLWLRPVKGACSGIKSTLCRKATPDEIKQCERDALLAEANERFPIGSKVRCNLWSFTDKVFIRTSPLHFFNSLELNIYADGEPWLYYDGKWAEVIVDTTPNITINGYKGEFKDDYVTFGCAQIDKKVFINANKTFENEESRFPNSNKYITSITIGKGTFTKEQIKEIAEYYKNK